MLLYDYPVFQEHIGLGSEPAGEDLAVRCLHTDGSKGLGLAAVGIYDGLQDRVLTSIRFDCCGRFEPKEHTLAVPAFTCHLLALLQSFDGFTKSK